MPDPVTKADAIQVVRNLLADGIDASFMDARDYLEAKAPLLDDDEFDEIAEQLGAEVEALVMSLDKAVQQYIY